MMQAMKIIACINEKGGCGKSTVAINIASYLHRQGKKPVVLVDADPQGTARDWRAASPDGADLPPVVAIDRAANLAGALRTLNAEYLVIDAPAKAGDMAAAIVSVSDIALIVLQPSGADVWASAAAVRLIQQKRAIGGAINAAFLVNRAASNTKLSRLIKSGEWNEYRLDQMASVIGNRAAFAQALTDGLSVFDLSDAAAKREIESAIKELEDAKWL